MNADRDHDSSLAWEIPPSVAVHVEEGTRSRTEEVGRLANELDEGCRPVQMSVQAVPAGVSRIHLRFTDPEEADRALSAAEAAVEAHPDLPCRVVAVVTTSSS